MKITHLIMTLSFLFNINPLHAQDRGDHLFFEAEGEAKGKHIVFISGDEEYHSEESMPMMAQIMANQGFSCSVLFAVDDQGIVNPTIQTSLSHSIALDKADAIVMCIRFRRWPEADMNRFVAAFERGVPLVALRTSTHAFKYPKEHKFYKYTWNAKKVEGWSKGFGREVLGETWVNHHGHHKHEGTRSVVEQSNASHPVLNGVGEIFGDSDVYGTNPKTPSTILLRGAVTDSLEPTSKIIDGPKNNPMMPIAWLREYQHASGVTNKILTTTMGAATDLADENLRRLVANGIYWGLGLEVPEKLDASIRGDYEPTFYGFGNYKKGCKPKDFIVNKSN